MNIRHYRFTLLALAALSPAISNASSEKDSADACARAFAAGLGTAAAGPAPSFKLVYHIYQPSSPIAAYFASDYTFDLQARNPKSGATIARARCSTDRHAAVIALNFITPSDDIRVAPSMMP
jgi:hypothetical protein